MINHNSFESALIKINFNNFITVSVTEQQVVNANAVEKAKHCFTQIREMRKYLYTSCKKEKKTKQQKRWGLTDF